MKNFISKNWKRILLIIGGIFIAINLIHIIITPATIPQDFLEYGPDIESDIFDKTNEIAEDVTDINFSSTNSGETSDEELANNENPSIVDKVSDSTGMPQNLTKGLLFFGLALAAVMVIAGITDGSDDKKKK